MKNILITGCAGYIGSVCAYRFLQEGYNIFGFDNLSTGHIETIEKLKQFGNFTFIRGNLKDVSDIQMIFQNRIDAVVHFAAFSQVGESEVEPAKYYTNNVSGSINLFGEMIKNNTKTIVFSSTAAIYGNPQETPIKENHPQNPINVYGRTKLTIEKILDDYDKAYGLKSAKLRYFNAAGASDDCIFGEIHNPETHLIPNVLNMSNLKVFGDDYPTPDGTCIRDYIDVEDLAEAHLSALKYISNNNESLNLNLGTKNGTSVKEIISSCENITGKNIKYEICPRRQGDPAILVADNTKAYNLLGWTPKRTVQDSIKKAYEFKKRCP